MPKRIPRKTLDKKGRGAKLGSEESSDEDSCMIDSSTDDDAQARVLNDSRRTEIRTAIKFLHDRSKNALLMKAIESFYAVKQHRDQLLESIAMRNVEFMQGLLVKAEHDKEPLEIDD